MVDLAVRGKFSPRVSSSSMSTAAIDFLLGIWKALDRTLLVGALGLGPVIAFPAFLWVYRPLDRPVERAVLSAALAWSVMVLLVAIPAVAFNPGPSYDFGLSALLFAAISAVAALVGVACIVALAWKFAMRWPIAVGVAVLPLVLASVKLARAAHEWDSWGRASHEQNLAMRRWLAQHPLHRAIVGGDPAEAERLARASPVEELGAATPEDLAPIHLAARAGLLRTTEILVQRGVDPNLPIARRDLGPPSALADPGLTASDLAIDAGRWEVLESLLNHGGVPTSARAARALLERRPDLFQRAGLAPDVVGGVVLEIIRDPVSPADEGARMLETIAACRFDPDALVARYSGARPETLLGHAIDAFWESDERARKARLGMVDWLLGRKVDTNREVFGTSSPGPTPLRLLLEGNFTTAEGRFAVEDMLEVADRLIAHGAKVRDGEECSPIALLVSGFHYAVMAGVANDPSVRYDRRPDVEKVRVLSAAHGRAKGARFVATLRSFVDHGARWTGVQACPGLPGDADRAVGDIDAFLPGALRAEFHALLRRGRQATSQ